MKALLEFIVQYVSFLYLDPRYRITDSSTRGLADIDASISFSSEQLKWDVVNDRGIIYFTAVPVFQDGSDWFALSLVRQYLDGGDDAVGDLAVDQANWLSTNLNRVERLFADKPTVARVCDELATLRRSNSSKRWGWPKPDEVS
ncbi:hypothetical protein [Mycobacterium sp. 852002-40037_SCH5390672]|uniref:hypothetical protein n=1 Tax=Mycobacterium sp. 852002-40037_SCH5390672 TaxID=1834089 RepID=UPI000805D14A|nr:hypothetical protein [Mycobacterium sp. 852002-40037_SCH5390672]OBB96608.1 hypothetical protein A5782_03520 [Mycobacterium sp. 852002-40037_SCH5390672]